MESEAAQSQAQKPSPRLGKLAKSWRDYEWGAAAPFVLVHLFAFGSLWTGVRWQDVVCCVALYFVRMFGVTGGYHRYFSHRTFKTSRAFQFVLAFLAQTSSQKGVIWWAQHHRDHHKFSDGERDEHSPVQWGLLHAHVGWLYDYTSDTDTRKVRDLMRYPELVWLDRYWYLAPIVLGVLVWLALGWSGLWIGFMLSTALLWHGTFTINSLSHVYGSRRYNTTDHSRNNLWLALITMGEGWHNNHHHYMRSTRQGFFWWEVDMTYYVLRILSAIGLVWDIREPPTDVILGGSGSLDGTGATSIERAA